MLIKNTIGYQLNLKIVGVGGVGCQTVREMSVTTSFKNVSFMTVGIDTGVTSDSTLLTHISLSKDTNKTIEPDESYKEWREIALLNKEKIRESIQGCDVVFITCNEGKGMGTGVAPVVADIASECGALVVAVVTTPFKLEGKQKKLVSDKGIELLEQSAGTTIVVNRQGIFENITRDTKVTEAVGKFKLPLYQGVKILSEIIKMTQLINIDLADLKTIMGNGGQGFIGEGVATGAEYERGQKAIEQAFSFPLTNNTIQDARQVLFNITGGKDLSMNEINDIATAITELAHRQADVKFGVTIDDTMTRQVKVTIIAASMNNAIPFKPYKADEIEAYQVST